MRKQRNLYIDGSPVPASGTDVLTVVDPSNGVAIGSAAVANAADVDAAVGAATRALRDEAWALMPTAERIDIVRRIADTIGSRAQELAELQTLQMGMPIRRSRGSMTGCQDLIHSYIDALDELTFEEERSDPRGHYLVRRRPVGVVAAIAPWNGPLPIVMNKVIPALLTGCTTVFKPAPETPFDAFEFAHICQEAGVPNGVVNVVTGGRETGEALVSHPDVNLVHFTGSAAAGHRIWEHCGSTFKRMSLELGGKSAGIVLDDVDLDAVLPLLLDSNFGNTGQVCKVLSRMLLPRTRFDEIVDAIIEAARSLRIGDPLNAATDLGPIVSERQLQRVQHYVALGEDEGAKLATGGKQPDDLPNGWYFEPTVFVGVDNDMTIAREEIFGPVMCAIAYGTIDDAVQMANDSSYGLHGGVFTRDVEHGIDIAKRFESGVVGVNRFSVPPSAPNGGVKDSGIGREHGPEGIGEFLEYQSVILPN